MTSVSSVVPLLSAEETDIWDKEIEKYNHRNLARDTPHEIWTKMYKEQASTIAALELFCINKCQERPHEYLMNLILLVGSRGVMSARNLQSCYTDDIATRAEAVNTPTIRWWVDRILEGVTGMPRNVAASGATRFFRATGKQKNIEHPCVGILSAENGWKEREVEYIMKTLFEQIGKPLLSSKDLGVNSDEYQTMNEEEKDELWSGGASHCATSTSCDNEFVNRLRSMLAEMGLEAPETLKVNPKKEPKPRKVKEFKVGDSVTSKNMRDLPKGTRIRNTGSENKTYWQFDPKVLFTWYGKNTKGFYVIENSAEKKGTYWRYRPISLSDMDRQKFVVERMPTLPETAEDVVSEEE